MTFGDIIASFNATVAAVKTLAELVGVVANAEKRIEINNAVLDLQSKIREHQAAQIDIFQRCNDLVVELDALRAELRDAQKALADAAGRKAEFARYRLVTVADELFLPALRQSAARGEPPHWLCPKCRASEVKSILHLEALRSSRPEHTLVKCPVCGYEDSFPGCIRPAFA